MLVSLHSVMIVLGIISAFWVWKSHRRTSIFILVAMFIYAIPLLIQVFPSVGNYVSIRQVFTDFVGTCVLLLALVARR